MFLILALMQVALARRAKGESMEHVLRELSKELCREGYCTHRCSGQG